MGFEDEYARRHLKKRNPLNAYLPVLGLLLAVALGAIAFVLSGPLHELVLDNLPDFPADDTGQLIVGGILFVLLLLITGMVYALFAPKPDKMISEKQLMKERNEIQAEKLRRKRQREALNRKAAEERRKQGH